MSMEKETLLQLQNISVHYGGVKALDGVDISLDEGEIVALMGPNGAGKSTILKTIFGLAPIHSGKVLWHEKEIKPISHEVVKRRIAEVMETFPVLRQKRKAKAGTLSGGQQQMLALARGLMTDPKILLLDEPSLGLAPKIVKEVFAKIKEINEKHKTAIMVVEHNIKSLLDIAGRGYLLDKGKVVFNGDGKDLTGEKVAQKFFLNIEN